MCRCHALAVNTPQCGRGSKFSVAAGGYAAAEVLNGEECGINRLSGSGSTTAAAALLARQSWQLPALGHVEHFVCAAAELLA
jgi:hypothetical protein